MMFLRICKVICWFSMVCFRFVCVMYLIVVNCGLSFVVVLILGCVVC